MITGFHRVQRSAQASTHFKVPTDSGAGLVTDIRLAEKTVGR